MKKKILYLFSDTGGGHRSAAKALIKAIEEIKKVNPPIQEMVDVFAECSRFLHILSKLYAPMIKYSPKIWGLFYYWFNDPKMIEKAEKLARPFIEKELAKLILQRRPDVIVSVHPLLNHVTVRAMTLAKHVVPLITVVTDPVSLHRTWVCQEAEKIIVATDRAKNLCIEYGADPKKIAVIGLPIDPKFTQKSKDKRILRKLMGLKEALFTVLLMGGGEGSGNMKKIVHVLNKDKLNIQLIVIAGRNERLKKQLEKEQYNFPIKIYGFTDEVPDIMSASDLVITKAGPGSIAESLAKKLPLIITSWLPGQEEGNVDFVVENKVGVVCKDTKRISDCVKVFLKPEVYNEYKERIAKVSDPKAVYKIAEVIMSYLYR